MYDMSQATTTKPAALLQCWPSCNGRHLQADVFKTVSSCCIAFALILWTLTGSNSSANQHLLPEDMEPAFSCPSVPTKCTPSHSFPELSRTGTSYQQTLLMHPPSRHSSPCWGMLTPISLLSWHRKLLLAPLCKYVWANFYGILLA